MRSRRKYLQLAGVGLSVGLAGCGDTPNPGGVGEAGGDAEVSDTPDPSESSDDDSVGSEQELEDEDDPVDDYVIDDGGRLAVDTDAILSEIEWFATEYNTAIRRYRNAHADTIRKIDNLIDYIDRDRAVTSRDLDEVSDSLERSVDITEDALEPHFTDHFPFGYIDREYLSEAKSYQQRADWPVVRQNLVDARSMYRAAITGTSTSERYSKGPIYNRLYEFIRGNDENDRFFELRLEGPMRDDFAAYVTRDESHVMYDPIGRRQKDSLVDLYAAFDEPDDRTHSLIMNVYNEGVPNTDRFDPTELEPMSVFVQKFEDAGYARTAYDSVIDEKTVEGVETWRPNGEQWQQVFYQNDGSTLYLYMMVTGEYLFVVGQSRDAWDKRPDDWNEHFDGTWLNPE